MLRYKTILGIEKVQCRAVTAAARERKSLSRFPVAPPTDHLVVILRAGQVPPLCTEDLGHFRAGQELVVRRLLYSEDASLYERIEFLVVDHAGQGASPATIGAVSFCFRDDGCFEWQVGADTMHEIGEADAEEHCFRMTGGRSDYRLVLRAVVVNASDKA